MSDLNSLCDYKPTKEWVCLAHQYIQNTLDNTHQRGDYNPPRIHSTATIHNSAVVCQGSVIGPNAIIGPNCYIKMGSYVGESCELGFCCDVSGGIILSNTRIAHVACISNSIVGPNCNLAFGFVTASRNIYERNIKFYLGPNERYTSDAMHHGAVLMDSVVTGVQVSVMPGATVGSASVIPPGYQINGYFCSNAE